MSARQDQQVPDAGTGMLRPSRQKWGSPWEVYPCPSHAGAGCSMCGGTGYRSVCNSTACHEHGCQGGGCSSSAEMYRSQQARKEKP